MDSEISGPELHLPALDISGFRGIDELSIQRLGRVTLLTGRNGVGKSTVLEAIRVFAGRLDRTMLDAVLEERGEVFQVVDQEAPRLEIPDYSALLNRRRARVEKSISIGAPSLDQTLTLGLCRFEELSEAERKLLHDGDDPEALVLKMCFGESERLFPVADAADRFLTWTKARGRYAPSHRSRRSEDVQPPIRCGSLGPGAPDDYSMLKLWEQIALTSDEDRAITALRLVHGDEIERVAFVGGGGARSQGARVIVKLHDQPNPVALRSLGDGAVRLFAAALALANCRGGFLVIDEAENGLHHQLQEDYWRMILQTAASNSVQVFATTHSADCVRGFARAATALSDVEGRLVRLERRGEQTRAVEYDEELLATAADQRIEVR